MKELPYFRWYPADAKADENYSTLTDAELGFFHRCLNDAWVNDGLPGDLKMLAKQMKVSPGYLAKVWAAVGRCFVLDGGGRFRNSRQEDERLGAIEKSKNSAKSAKTRWEADANALRTHCESDARAYVYDSVSVSVVDSKKETSLQRDDFSKFLEACETAEMRGSETDLRVARSEWGRLSLADRLAACQGIKERVAAGELADPGFRPLPQNYLKNKTWQRTVREKREPAMDRQHARRNEVMQLTKLFGAIK